MKGKSKLITLIISLLLVSSLVLVACAAPKPATPAVPKGPIKMGYLGDLTGPVSLAGVWFTRFFKDITDYYNAKGGIKGYPIELRDIDTGFDPPRVIAGYKALKDWGALIIGNIGTRPAMAIKEMHKDDKIPGVTNSMTAAAVYPPEWMYCHYVWVTQGAFLGLKWIWETQWDYDKQGPLKIGIITTDEPMGRFNAPCIKKYAEQLGKGKIEVVAMEYIPVPTMTSEAQVLRFKTAGAHWVFTNFNSGMFTPVVAKDMKKIGATYKVMHQTSSLQRTSLRPAEGALEGHYLTSVWGQPEDKGWGIDLVKELWTTYQKKPLEELYANSWEDYACHGFNQYRVWYKACEMALDAVGYDKLTPEAIKVHGLDKMKDLDTGNITPGVSYTDYPGDRVGVGKSRVLQVKGKEFVKVTDWMNHVPESNDAALLTEWVK